MTLAAQKSIFTFAVLFMFGAFLSAVVSCPPPLDGERPIIFALGVFNTLAPALALLGLLRVASRE